MMFYSHINLSKALVFEVRVRGMHHIADMPQSFEVNPTHFKDISDFTFFVLLNCFSVESGCDLLALHI